MKLAPFKINIWLSILDYFLIALILLPFSILIFTRTSSSPPQFQLPEPLPDTEPEVPASRRSLLSVQMIYGKEVKVRNLGFLPFYIDENGYDISGRFYPRHSQQFSLLTDLLKLLILFHTETPEYTYIYVLFPNSFSCFYPSYISDFLWLHQPSILVTGLAGTGIVFSQNAIKKILNLRFNGSSIPELLLSDGIFSLLSTTSQHLSIIPKNSLLDKGQWPFNTKPITSALPACQEHRCYTHSYAKWSFDCQKAQLYYPFANICSNTTAPIMDLPGYYGRSCKLYFVNHTVSLPL